MFKRAFLLLIAFLPLDAGSAERARPNFVMVFIDDMGWGDFSCFGNTQVKTEQVDRLASEGMRFEQFYVNSPLCSPSRTALTTGQYPQRWRINSFLSNREANENRGMAQWLDTSAPTLARTLQKAGYATGHFGKWHMGGQRDVGEAPLITEYGFDESLTQFEGLGPRLLPLGYAEDGKPPVKHSLGSHNLGRGPMIWMDRSRITEGFVGAAIGFMSKAVADKKPFYVNLWPDDVHSPFFPPLDRRGDARKRALYHAVLKTMDEQLGALFDYVRNEAQLRENTIILVCSDNGPEPGAGSAGPFRGGKGVLYEGGIRSPLVVWAPGFMPAERVGTRNESSVLSAMDVFPSLLALAEVKTPFVDLDGEDLADTLVGKSDASRKASLFWRRPPDRPGPRAQPLPDLAVRENNWKVLCRFDGSQPQLYNLSTDRGETNDVASLHAERASRMAAAARDWYLSPPATRGVN